MPKDDQHPATDATDQPSRKRRRRKAEGFDPPRRTAEDDAAFDALVRSMDAKP